MLLSCVVRIDIKYLQTAKSLHNFVQPVAIPQYPSEHSPGHQEERLIRLIRELLSQLIPNSLQPFEAGRTLN